MSAEGRRWLAYAQENRRAAAVCLESSLFNRCLQNAQQAVEKALKALHLASGPRLKTRRSESSGEISYGPSLIGQQSVWPFRRLRESCCKETGFRGARSVQGCGNRGQR